MHLEDLEPHEQLALAGLVRILTRMDGELSAEETAAISGLARELGSPAFWARMAEAQEQLGTPGAVTAAAEGVTRAEARAWIYGMLLGLAAADGIDVAETQMLDWLMKVWELG